MMAEIKPAYGETRARLKDVIPLRTPYSIYFFPTNLCNFRCTYCAHGGGLKNFEEEYGLKLESMSLETFTRAIDQISKFEDKLKVLNLSGQGEPLLNRYLPEMIEYAKKMDVADRIEIITNASLLNEELSNRLIDSGLDTIRVSLQGVTSKKYKDICGKDIDFDKFVAELKYLYSIKKQCQIYVKVMDVSLDEGEEEQFYNIFRDISDRMYVENCKPVYDGVESTKDIDVSTDRYGLKSEYRHVCPLPFYMLGILPDGTISPCETIYVPDILGNVWTDDISEVWTGDKMKAFQKMQMDKLRHTNPKCARCCAPNDVSRPEDVLD